MTVIENAAEIKSLREMIEALQKENSSLKKDNAEFKDRLKKIEEGLNQQNEARKRAEIEKTKHSVIIKGVGLHKDCSKGEIETKKQTNEVVKTLLGSLDIENSIGFYEAIRFKPSDKSKNKGPELVKLTVSSVKHKAKLYESLAKTKKSKKMPKVSVTDEIPTFLREKQATLEKLAYEIRQKAGSTKTRIFFKGTTIVLKIKKAGEDLFSECDEKGEPLGESKKKAAKKSK